jgi:hypothetical protein
MLVVLKHRRALFALLIFRAFLSGAVMAASLAAADVPSANEQQRMIDSIQQFASRYLDNLPNFVCARVTQQYEAGKTPDHWKQRETLTSKLVFNRGRENQTLELVNGRAIPANRYVAQALETEGEFGILISNVLDSDAAQISWSRWEDLRGSRLAVFAYEIDRKHSTLSLALGGMTRQILPYRGLIYADPASGEVWRITNSPFDIPDSIATKSITTTIDYGSVDIGNRHYFLPVTATIWLDTGHNNVLNRVSFRDYRKFEAESTITFMTGSGSN